MYKKRGFSAVTAANSSYFCGILSREWLDEFILYSMRIFNLVVLIFCFIAFGSTVCSQSPLDIKDIETKKRRKTIFDHTVLVQANVSNSSSMELGYSLVKVNKNSFNGISLSSAHFLRDDYRMALKPRAYFSTMNILFGVSMPYVFDFEGSQEVYLRPEIGLTMGWAHIVYSNNIAVIQEETQLIPTHSLGIGINFLWGTLE